MSANGYCLFQSYFTRPDQKVPNAKRSKLVVVKSSRLDSKIPHDKDEFRFSQGLGHLSSLNHKAVSFSPKDRDLIRPGYFLDAFLQFKKEGDIFIFDLKFDFMGRSLAKTYRTDHFISDYQLCQSIFIDDQEVLQGQLDRISEPFTMSWSNNVFTVKDSLGECGSIIETLSSATSNLVSMDDNSAEYPIAESFLGTAWHRSMEIDQNLLDVNDHFFRDCQLDGLQKVLRDCSQLLNRAAFILEGGCDEIDQEEEVAAVTEWCLQHLKTNLNVIEKYVYEPIRNAKETLTNTEEDKLPDSDPCELAVVVTKLRDNAHKCKLSLGTKPEELIEMVAQCVQQLAYSGIIKAVKQHQLPLINKIRNKIREVKDFENTAVDNFMFWRFTGFNPEAMLRAIVTKVDRDLSLKNWVVDTRNKCIWKEYDGLLLHLQRVGQYYLAITSKAVKWQHVGTGEKFEALVHTEEKLVVDSVLEGDRTSELMLVLIDTSDPFPIVHRHLLVKVDLSPIFQSSQPLFEKVAEMSIRSLEFNFFSYGSKYIAYLGSYQGGSRQFVHKLEVIDLHNKNKLHSFLLDDLNKQFNSLDDSSESLVKEDSSELSRESEEEDNDLSNESMILMHGQNIFIVYYHSESKIDLWWVKFNNGKMKPVTQARIAPPVLREPNEDDTSSISEEDQEQYFTDNATWIGRHRIPGLIVFSYDFSYRLYLFYKDRITICREQRLPIGHRDLAYIISEWNRYSAKSPRSSLFLLAKYKTAPASLVAFDVKLHL